MSAVSLSLEALLISIFQASSKHGDGRKTKLSLNYFFRNKQILIAKKYVYIDKNLIFLKIEEIKMN